MKKLKSTVVKVTPKQSPEQIEKRLRELGVPYEKIEKSYKLYLDSNLMNDIKFRQIAKSKKAIEEILRVILKDENLEVKGISKNIGL